MGTKFWESSEIVNDVYETIGTDLAKQMNHRTYSAMARGKSKLAKHYDHPKAKKKAHTAAADAHYRAATYATGHKSSRHLRASRAHLARASKYERTKR